MVTKTRATIADLSLVPENGKAELVSGELVVMPATGVMPGNAGGEILTSLRNSRWMNRLGRALPDNVGFLVKLPHRELFSPDAAYDSGPDPGMRFYQGTLVFAAEVRSEGDYGPPAEREMARKREDNFAAGSFVVWDVGLLEEDVVRVYRADQPLTPTVYRRGEMAEAEPAVPGRQMTVDDLFY